MAIRVGGEQGEGKLRTSVIARCRGSIGMARGGVWEIKGGGFGGKNLRLFRNSVSLEPSRELRLLRENHYYEKEYVLSFRADWLLPYLEAKRVAQR